MKYNFTLILIIAIFNFNTAQTIDANLVELNFHENSNPHNFTAAKSGFYFTATDGFLKKFGEELWYSDGTKQGTKMVKDIKSGQNSSNPRSLVYIYNTLYFTASDGKNGAELWKSDGTEAGTKMIKDIRLNNNNDDYYDGPSNLLNLNGKLYFTATNDINGVELWTSNGAESGTYMIKDINPNGSSNPSGLFIFKNNLYFVADDGINGLQLWKSDGTEAGTKMMNKINPKESSFQFFNQFLVLNDHFYFFANSGKEGFELWKSDGTESGSTLVKDIRAGINSSSYSLKGGVANNLIIFEANDGINGSEMWKSDGTESGTSMIRNINKTSSNSLLYDSKFIEFNNEIYFVANDDVHGFEVWKTDGTSNGTILLKDINNGDSSSSVEQFYVDRVNNKLLFYATSTNYKEKKLWSSDGTLNGTIELADVKSSNNSGFVPSFVTINNITFFSGENETNGNEIWKTNGTVAGTSFFVDLNYSNSSSPSKFTEVNGDVFFKARGKEFGNQLFKSNGTISGTQLVKDINPGYDAIDNLSDMKVINGTLFFSAIDATHGYELWKSDGTEKGTVMVKDINPGGSSSLRNYNETQSFTVINDILYFSANDGVNGFELWRSDGTESGTYMIKDIKPTTGIAFDGGSPREFTLLNNTIYFIANDLIGTGIWSTNGTASGTIKIIDLNDVRTLRAVNNKLIIFASTGNNAPDAVWISDGTKVGTHHLKTFSVSSDIRYNATFNNELYFVATSPESFNKALYKTDGTIAGTILLFDGATHPTLQNLSIKNILTCGSYVYFAIQDYFGSNKELWRTNGKTTEKIVGQDSKDLVSIKDLTCYNDNILYLAELFARKIWLINDNLSKPLDLNINVLNGPNFEENNSIYELGATSNNLYFQGRNDLSGNELYITKINSSSLGISDHINLENNNLKRITVYPNPANKLVNIKSLDHSEITKFELWDFSGKKIYTELNEDLKNEVKFDVSKLSAGIYFIKVTLSDGKISNAKVFVNH
ncbi:ELWxxDGT repeat protein [Flavobacterium hibernum]|uniref:T9SS C-terminal target domain-containing protein n=1 Tax=Flavobacterium hibernum TaxID=37752 RepID=A0ABX4C0T2_9FLAO|nr:ELWxxDGT repeat protein [Flavobacterium hibernum]OXA85586.1 T9SS C-terminal target domain-containing protein [Flavobacterium hibernum]STO18491.1 Por secretion system C-terminal sorting domain [Flavobacterium hibernum]